MMIAEVAGLYRTPVTLHNVTGILLNVASQQLAAAIFDCPRIECTRRAASLDWGAGSPLEIRDGRMKVSHAPGLGLTLDEEWVNGHRKEGEPAW
jgi:L-alanine-DL-glutamate epimerase-like enolase superfamily enzyme